VTVLRAQGLGKRYKRKWALTNCTLEIEAGHVTGLVGPNGAGKSTLLNISSGMLEPTTGTIEVCGGLPGSGPEQLAKVGYVAQNTPVYAHLSIEDHLRLGAHLNPNWDTALATRRIERLGLDPKQHAGKLSGGQRAQLALTMGIAKRPELARREFLSDLMEAVAEHGLSVVLSSHLVNDLERVCDQLIVLVDSQVRIASDIEELIATHHRLTGPRRDLDTLPSDQHVISAKHTDRQTTVLVRTEAPILDPAWTVAQLTLEDVVLEYMSNPATVRPALEVLR
jgi:ABC-2 type transport system ATP-binding protein